MATEDVKWEIVHGGMGSAFDIGPWVSRFPVPGGWLYRTDMSTAHSVDVHVVFVPDPDDSPIQRIADTLAEIEDTGLDVFIKNDAENAIPVVTYKPQEV